MLQIRLHDRQIRLQAIVLSYDLAQVGEDLSPFTVINREIAIKQT